MAFQFRFSTVQKLRENHRDQQRFSLVGAVKTVEEIASQLAALESQAETLRQEKTQMLETGGTFRFSEIQRYQKRQQWLQEQHARVLAESECAKRKAESCHSALVEADKEVKTLEKLEEKQRHRYERMRNEK